mgnify:CR=1 FL=1
MSPNKCGVGNAGLSRHQNIQPLVLSPPLLLPYFIRKIKVLLMLWRSICSRKPSGVVLENFTFSSLPIGTAGEAFRAKKEEDKDL